MTVEVIGSALASIAEEMGEALVRSSISTNIKERRDCSTAICDAAGLILSQAEHIPMHLGSFVAFIPAILDRYAVADIHPGDIFIGNDAYEGGGTHLPDFVLAEPVFCENILSAWVINTAHHADFADRGHAHIFQEGIRIPPVRLVRQGVTEDAVQSMILLNCQSPTERLSDLRAQRAACRLGVVRLKDLFRKYGAPTVAAAGQALLDHAERRLRAAIATVPDGRYDFDDVFESPETPQPLPIGVTVSVKADEMTLAFRAPAQVRSSVNMTYTALFATVCYAVKAALDPDAPPNSGLARPLHIEAPAGSLLNCVSPAAVNGRINTCQRVVDLIHGALARALPARLPAAGCGAAVSALFSSDNMADHWIYLDVLGGGGGARPAKSGMDGVQQHMTNTSNLPIEALEMEYPLEVVNYAFRDGSAGEGRHRGGMGLSRIYKVLKPCWLELDGSRLATRPWGLDGGGEGMNCVIRVDGQVLDPVPPILHLDAAQQIEIHTAGGGGYDAWG
ncbi:hydantoinase B/oxoprolinase family protein [Gluconacetobacter azotocaptans]|uniref:hydantoinase B/oxoprolinase family protein n=1 Tax=Gluconacetobacter azotocaptans TaxID=142834 RepID=UPI0030B80A1F